MLPQDSLEEVQAFPGHVVPGARGGLLCYGLVVPGSAERFEERLRLDPELEELVVRLREIGRALRAEGEEPGPGFYARARNRFETAVARKRRYGPRVLAWEAAGLATAVLLVAAVFVPGLLRDLRRPRAGPRSALGEEQRPAAGSMNALEEPAIPGDANKVLRAPARPEPAPVTRAKHPARVEKVLGEDSLFNRLFINYYYL